MDFGIAFSSSPPPPPPNVSGLQPDASKARTVTEHLEIHRQIPSCAGCHAKIDPLGISLENYNAIGEWRDAELPWSDPASESSTKGDQAADQPIPIRPFGKLADGSILDGHQSLREYLKSRRKDVAIGLSEQLMIYALGRGLRTSDRQEVHSIVNSLESTQWPLQDLILAVVQSHAFKRFLFPRTRSPQHRNPQAILNATRHKMSRNDRKSIPLFRQRID